MSASFVPESKMSTMIPNKESEQPKESNDLAGEIKPYIEPKYNSDLNTQPTSKSSIMQRALEKHKSAVNQPPKVE